MKVLIGIKEPSDEIKRCVYAAFVMSEHDNGTIESAVIVTVVQTDTAQTLDAKATDRAWSMPAIHYLYPVVFEAYTVDLFDALLEATASAVAWANQWAHDPTTIPTEEAVIEI